jgi:hypothetical protein
MRRRIEALADQIEEFVSEDGHDALVIECAGEATGFVGAALDLVGQRGGIDPAFALLDAFESEAALADRLRAWAGAVVDQFRLGVRPDAPLSALATALHAARSARVVLLVCPSVVADEDAYIVAVLELVRVGRATRPPLRVVAREAAGGRVRARLAAEGHPTLEAALDTSPVAVREALVDEARDPDNDPAIRAAALLQVAMTDAGTGRADEALPVLVDLATRFRAMGDGCSRAIAVLGAGTALWQLGRLEDARTMISVALGIALEAKLPAVVLSGAMSAGHLSMRLGDAADADARFDVAARLAAHTGSPHALAEALYERGHALERRGLPADAYSVWTRAADAARIAGVPERERMSLEEALRIQADAAIEGDRFPHERRLAAIAHGGRCPHEHEHEHAP